MFRRAMTAAAPRACAQFRLSSFAASSTVTLAGAQSALDAAAQHAAAQGWKVSISVVDAGGYVVAQHRMDGANAISAEIAPGKARAAAVFGKETKVMEDMINQGRTAMVTAPGQVLMEGGIPVVNGGVVVGGVGVSGVRKDQDAEVASKAVEALLK
eukprot:TRINITY_DN1812_c0_g1_i1.p2 TRINITY_DN1812_c0_g1~~TRINITY_DN1812_c0_g1_i1.p2  ORF type:complete len:156 (+),score=57.42 TRINITY_DN1812_c0_g1_i1:79-546(+)